MHSELSRLDETVDDYRNDALEQALAASHEGLEHTSIAVQQSERESRGRAKHERGCPAFIAHSW